MEANKLSPLQAIRKRCLDCRGGHWVEVRDCDPSFAYSTIKECPLYPYRFGRIPDPKPELSTLKAIRAFCLHCCNDSAYEVSQCPAEDCPAWPFRDGHNPNRKGMGNRNGNIRDNLAFLSENRPVRSVPNDSEYEDDEIFNEDD